VHFFHVDLGRERLAHMEEMFPVDPCLAFGGACRITLALDGVSDTSPMNLMSCLSESGVLVSYGGVSRKPMVVQPGSFIFKKQTIRGFWASLLVPVSQAG
jgi:hypothetical protein